MEIGSLDLDRYQRFGQIFVDSFIDAQGHSRGKACEAEPEPERLDFNFSRGIEKNLERKTWES